MTSLEWLQFLLSYTLQVSLVIGVAAALDRWTHAANTKARIWTACFISLLGILGAGLLLPRLHWFHPWSQLGPATLLAVTDIEYVMGRTLLAIWLLGVGVMLIRFAVEFWQVQHFVAGCAPISGEDAELVQSLTPKASLRPSGRSVEFRVSPEGIGPFCYQFHQPLVFMPRSLIAGDRCELRHVLEHELTHLQTQHPMQLFLQRLVQCVLWFHPLVWISSRRAQLVREFVCDDAATQDVASTASYLRTLLRIVEQRYEARCGTFMIGRSASELRLRAKRLASEYRGGDSSRAMLALLGLFAAAAFVSQLWLPTDPLASSRTARSPWPTWSAEVLHSLDFSVRDFQPFDARTQVHELIHERRELQAKRE